MHDSIWDICEEFVRVFAPVKKLTLKLQEEQMNLGDFYKIWLSFKLELTKDEKTKTFSKELYSNIVNRERNFINNPLVIAAVYLDCRFRLMLSPEDACNAKRQILKTLKFSMDYKLIRKMRILLKSQFLVLQKKIKIFLNKL